MGKDREREGLSSFEELWISKVGEQLGKRQKRREEEVKGHGDKERLEKLKKTCVVQPYMKGVTGSLQRAYKKHDIHLFCKAEYIIRNAIVCPKDTKIFR